MGVDIPAARLERLRELVASNGVVSLKQAQAVLAVSEMTVRRDFAALEEMGLALRTRGGVIGVGRLAPDTSAAERQGRHPGAKAAIAEHAISLVDDGDTIFLSGGTTCLALARALAARADLTVITNSVAALTELMRNPRLTVIATGGQVSHLNDDMTGPVAEAMLAQFRTVKAFIGASGVNPDGVFNSNLARAATDRVMLQGAAEVFVLADHTKVGAAALTLVTPLSGVRRLVTDLPLRKPDQRWLTRAGVVAVVAMPDAAQAAGKEAVQ